MPTERERQEKKLIEKAKQLARKACARGIKAKPDTADWMSKPPEELARMVRSLDPKVVKELADLIGVDVSPEMLSRVDGRSVAKIRDIVKENM